MSQNLAEPIDVRGLHAGFLPVQTDNGQRSVRSSCQVDVLWAERSIEFASIGCRQDWHGSMGRLEQDVYDMGCVSEKCECMGCAGATECCMGW